MKLLFEDIKDEGKSIDLSFSFETDGINVNVESFSGNVYKTGPECFLDGMLEITFEADCDRCLKKFKQPESERIQISISKRVISDDEDEEVELSEDDLGIYIVEGDEIDFQDIIEQEAALLLPMQLVCDENCAGICPQCGKEITEDGCGCEEIKDPRWEALKKLK